MSEEKAITVMPERQPLGPRALAGGIVGTNLGLLTLWASFARDVGSFGVIIGPTMTLALLTALAAFVIRNRSSSRSLTRFNRDLVNLNAMMERGLINDGDYHTLKQRIIDNYQPQRVGFDAIATPAFWGAMVGLLFSITMEVTTMMIPAYIFLSATLIPGVGGAAVGAIGTVAVRVLQHRLRHRELPSGEPAGWQALGTRQSLPLIDRRPKLK